MIIQIIKDLIFSFLATIACSAFLSAPKKGMIPTGVIGMAGWMVYSAIQNNFNNSILFAAFFAAFIVSTLGEIAAKLYKKPATLFTLPALLPLVPGAGVYYTMLDFVNKKGPSALNRGIETLLIAGAIALGIIVSSVFSNSIRRKSY